MDDLRATLAVYGTLLEALVITHPEPHRLLEAFKIGSEVGNANLLSLPASDEYLSAVADATARMRTTLERALLVLRAR